MESLITYQDGKFGHLHKTLGLVSLVHFALQFGNFFNLGAMQFDNRTWMFLVFHLLLSWSSTIFHLPAIRSVHAPMIWPEFRAHSILFATRSLVAMALTLNQVSSPWTRFANVLTTMALADLATIYYKVTVTTMRDMPFPDWVSQTTRDRVNLYYSVSQVLATGILLFSPSMERAMFILFPIQIAAFLMTLVRKQIISPLSWHVLYAGSLGLNYLHSLLALDNLPVGFYLGCLLFCLMRFRYRWNKYFLWTLIGLVQGMVQNEFVQSMLKQGARWTFTLSSYALGQTAPVCLTCS
jgi:hypothetical protein